MFEGFEVLWPGAAGAGEGEGGGEAVAGAEVV